MLFGAGEANPQFRRVRPRRRHCPIQGSFVAPKTGLIPDIV